MPLLALTRAVSPTIAECELTHLARVPLNVARAEAQHAAYEAALVALGCRVQRVTAAPENPDAVFIEDTAVVLDEVAVITRPGAEGRRHETDAVAEALAPYRVLVHVEAPGTLDGGDVMALGRTVYVGRTARTNDAGIRQLRHALSAHGYDVTAVDVRGCLHLKSAVTSLDDYTVLCNAAWVDPRVFSPHRVVFVDPMEPSGANVVRVGSTLLAAEAWARTNSMLRTMGYTVGTVPADELAKAEGAVTCCSLVLRVR